MNQRARALATGCLGLALVSASGSILFAEDSDPRAETIAVPEDDAPRRLTDAERAAGWRSLSRRDAWRAAEGDDFPDDGWSVEDDTLTIREAGFLEFRAGGDLLSRESFGDFVLDFEFWITRGGNSGVKYRAETRNQLGYVHALGCEFQILDDANHADAERGREGTRRLAGLYDLIAPVDARFRGIETWNHGRIHLENGRLSHYLNGVRVVDVELGSTAWREAVTGSKFAKTEGYCASPTGPIALQDHGDLTRFRNVRIRSLDPVDDDS